MRAMPAVSYLILAVLLAGTSGCSDSGGPAKAGTGTTVDPLPGLFVSAPVDAPAGVPPLASKTAAGGSVVYVSLMPGTVPMGVRATIRDQATGLSVTTAVVDGGFDPVAVAASVGDTLLVAIAGAAAMPSPVQLIILPHRPVRVVRTSPPAGGRDVPLNSIVVIVFSGPIDPTTLTTGAVQLWRGTTPVAGTVRLSDATGIRAELHPDSLFASATAYRLVVTQAIRDVNGEALAAPLDVSFTTGTIGPATGLVFASVSGGYYHTCGVTTAGAAYCWGDNYTGTLGDGTRTSSTTPVPVAGGLAFATVSAGTYHTCGVTTSGKAYCWGTWGIGVVGYGPVLVAEKLTFATVSAGSGHSCGVTTTGAAYCWGDGFFGQRGDGDTASAYPQTPVPVAGGLMFAAVSAGGNHSCGVTTTGVAYCWGVNAWGQLGVGTSTGPERCQNPGLDVYSLACSTVPVAVAGGLAFKTVIASRGVTCGITRSDAPYCWGETYGLLGDDTSTGAEWCDWSGDGAVPCSSVPVAVAGGLNLASLTTGRHSYACGLTPTGEAYCWGTNPNGDVNPTPVAVAGGLTFATLSNGLSSTCGVTTNGVAYCWGANERGQLGDGTATSSSVPVKVAGQP
jgi:alpha-tubulin suppressor-like RCC1 family protein